MSLISGDLRRLKRLFQAFEERLARQKADVTLVVDEICRIHQEILALPAGGEPKLVEISDDLASWTTQVLELLSNEALDAVEASFVFAEVKDPSYGQIIAKINTYLYSQTKDLREFFS